MIENCCICGNKVRTMLKLASREIYGMAKVYTQNVGMCENCGFIFTQNPFSSEQLANRYKRESKYEYESEECIHTGGI